MKEKQQFVFWKDSCSFYSGRLSLLFLKEKCLHLLPHMLSQFTAIGGSSKIKYNITVTQHLYQLMQNNHDNPAPPHSISPPQCLLLPLLLSPHILLWYVHCRQKFEYRKYVSCNTTNLAWPNNILTHIYQIVFKYVGWNELQNAVGLQLILIMRLVEELYFYALVLPSAVWTQKRNQM